MRDPRFDDLTDKEKMDYLYAWCDRLSSGFDRVGRHLGAIRQRLDEVEKVVAKIQP